jgi:nitrogen-specific signal transduction histidine kinase
VIVDFSSLEWESLNVITRVKECDDSMIILGVGRQVKKEIVQAARQTGLTQYIDSEKDITSLLLVIREQMEKKVLASRMEDEKLVRELSPSLLSPEKERTFSPQEWKLLEEMSRFLGHGYNINELMQFFLNLINRMFGIARLCFILKDRIRKTYVIRACMGMTEEVKEYVQLHPQRGLVKFLIREGTAVTKENVLQGDFRSAYEIKQEMKLIQSNVVVPLSPQGELIGIVGLGAKITGEEMSAREIKQVFLLCNQIGLAIQNLLFYEEMCYQKEYIESILENATSCVISIDKEQKITTCNPRAQKVLNLDGYTSLAGKDMRILPSPLGDLLFSTFSKGIIYKRKEVYVPAIKRLLGISTSQIKGSGGKVSGSVMIFTDLTPVKYLQKEEEKAHKRDLLAQVAVRLSHELRNSLVPIKSLAELLPSKYDDKEFRESLLLVVTEEIERINNFIERLTFFSQPLRLDKTAESLPDLVTKTLEKIKKKSRNKLIQLSTACKEANLQIYVDKARIIEALSHIISNSIETVTKQTPRIDINCASADSLPEDISLRIPEKMDSGQPSQYVKIEIKDNGPGLPGGNVDNSKIFDPFFTTKNRGIGLGLTIARNIIEEHGGGIVPLSEPKKGVTMVVYLPRYRLPL